MKCPICNNDMELYQEEPAYSKKKGINYKRTRYVCRTDDVWGRLEIPQPKETATEADQNIATAPTP